MRRPSHALRTAAAALAIGVSPAALAQEIGTAGAVNPATTGTPPNRPTRVIELGAKVVFRERIATSPIGTAQIIFTDKSTLSLGPNSAVVIDEYVYDPASGSGRMAATLTKGLLRFVGGGTSHTGGAQITTPAATIGIRGGVGTVAHGTSAGGGPAEGTWAALHFGRMTVSTGAGRQDITRPGFAVTVQGIGAVPTPPVRVTTAQMALVNAQLTSKPGQTGGRPVAPAAVAQAQQLAPTIGQTTTEAVAVQSQRAARETNRGDTLGISGSPASPTSPTQIQQISTNINRQVTTQTSQEVAQGSHDTPAGDGNQPNGGVTPTPPRGALPTGPFALAMQPDPSLGSGAPFLPANFVGGQRPFYNSPVLGYATPATTPSGAQTSNGRVLQAGLHITGQGASQTSAIYVFAGNAYVSPNSGQPTFAGGFTGTSRVSATNGFPGRANSGAVASGSDFALSPEGVPVGVRIRPGSLNANDAIVPETASYFRGDGTPVVNYGFTQNAAVVPTPAQLGNNRPETVLTGYAAGLMRTYNQTTGTASGPAFGFEGFAGVVLEAATGRFGAVVSGANATPSTGDTFSDAYLPFGSLNPGDQSSRGTYVDYNNFGGRESRGGAGNTFRAEVNGEVASEHRGLFVTAQTVNAASFFPGVNVCDCEYTRWGFWSSDTIRTDGSGTTFQDMLHLGTWVAGRPTAIGSLPTTGTATYSGHAVATIQNGAAQYIAGSNFTNTVNFGNQTGLATIANLDGRSYSGTVSIPAGGTTFGGSLSGPGSTATLYGQFYQGRSGPAGEMGGGLQIQGTNYLGRGIFAASTPGIAPGSQ